jgi:hypothetical protein
MSIPSFAGSFDISICMPYSSLILEAFIFFRRYLMHELHFSSHRISLHHTPSGLGTTCAAKILPP